MDATFYFNSGCNKIELQDYQGAIEDFNKVTDINPNLKEAYNKRGFAKERMKDWVGALNDYKNYDKLNDNGFGIRYKVLIAKGKITLAEYYKAI